MVSPPRNPIHPSRYFAPLLLVALLLSGLARSVEPRDTEPRDTEPRDTEPRDTEPRDTEPRDTEPRDTEPRDTDTIEFLSGASLEGTVTRIDKPNREVTIEANIAGRVVPRTYPYSKIHAIQYRGQRYVLNEKPVAPTPGARGSGGESDTRSRTDVQKLIDTVGRSQPDWYESTPLDFPQSLDLSWPQPPPGKGWNNQKNVGQYLWDVINPNPQRWRSGVKLMYHLLEIHQNNSELRTRITQSLAGMYFNFFQDYPRAAYWWQKAGVRAGDPPSIALAECYWRMGNQKMAEAAVDTRLLYPSLIKLYGDMGETRKALETADTYVRVGGQPQQAYLLAGDAARSAGEYPTAMRYYQKVIDAPPHKNREYQKRAVGRANDCLEAIRLAEKSDVRNVRDGTYRASSPAYAGQLEVEVRVSSHRIDAVEVTRHTEKQFYSAIADTTRQIIEKQSVQGIDSTSRATITSVAIINATAKALASGAK